MCGSGKQAGAKHTSVLSLAHASQHLLHSDDLANALGVSFDGLVIRY